MSLGFADSVTTILKKFSDKTTALLALNVDSYTRLAAYNTASLNQATTDLEIKGLALTNIKILNEGDPSDLTVHPYFWSGTEIGLMSGYRTLSGGVYYARAYSSYRTYSITTGLLSDFSTISVDWLTGIPVRKTSTGYIGGGTGTQMYKYDTSFLNKTAVTIPYTPYIANYDATKKVYTLESDLVCVRSDVNTAGAGSILTPQISVGKYSLAGALSTTTYFNVDTNVQREYGVVKINIPQVLIFGDFILQPRVLFGKTCFFVTNVSTGALYHIPVEQMVPFGADISNPDVMPILDFYVDTSIHILAVIPFPYSSSFRSTVYSNLCVYMSFLII